MRSRGARSDTLAHTCVELASPFGSIALLLNSLRSRSIGDAWLGPELVHRSGIRTGKEALSPRVPNMWVFTSLWAETSRTWCKSIESIKQV